MYNCLWFSTSLLPSEQDDDFVLTITWHTNTLFIQSFRGCHCADVHPEHVYPLRCPRALWMRHLCEDITRLGGGTVAVCTSDFNLLDSKWCLIDRLSWTSHLMKPSVHSAWKLLLSHSIWQKMVLLWTCSIHYCTQINQQTVQKKTLNSRACVCGSMIT